MSDFEEWLNRDKKKKRGTYRDRVLSGEQKSWKDKKKTRLNAFSKKQQKKNTSYENAKAKYLKENPACEICGKTDNLSIHHKAKRGDLIDDPDFFMTTCLTGTYLNDMFPELNRTEGCHNVIESNKRWAREQGYLFSDSEVQEIKRAKDSSAGR